MTIRPLPERYLPLGPIRRINGVDRSLLVERFPEEAEGDYLFVEIEGIRLPLPIEEPEVRGEQAVTLFVRTEELPEWEELEPRLRGREAFAAAREGDDDPAASREPLYRRLRGWLILQHPEGKPVGRVESWDETTANILLRVRSPEGEELLIPWVPDWVVTQDEAERTLTLRLPQGLCD